MENATNNILSGIRCSITEIPKTTVNECVYILHRLQILEIMHDFFFLLFLKEPSYAQPTKAAFI